MKLDISPETGSRGRVDVAPINLLDHGYIVPKVVFGDEEAFIEAARQSTGKGFLGWDPDVCPHCQGSGVDEVFPDAPEGILIKGCFTCSGKGKLTGDLRLLKYLYSNHHDTPFEMGGIIFEVQAPIFVFREWHRHRTQSYNEMSARYTPLPNLAYVPSVDRIMINAGGTNKQAGTVAGAAALTREAAEAWRTRLQTEYAGAQDFYEYGLDLGIPKELARVDLPVGRYSRMWASADIRCWLAFMTLRSQVNPGAQWEIRQYGDALSAFVDVYFPRTMNLFRERFGIQ